VGQYDESANVSTCGDSIRQGTRERRTDLLPEISLDSLTIGENLVIWRRRQELTQEQAAEKFGLKRNSYGVLERIDKTESDTAYPKVEKPTSLCKVEICFLLRRRSKKTIPICAEEAGVTRYWFNKMELGKAPSETLVNYWIKNAG
jgi:DNA-binding XRE family transcriptional regulator